MERGDIARFSGAAYDPGMKTTRTWVGCALVLLLCVAISGTASGDRKALRGLQGCRIVLEPFDASDTLRVAFIMDDTALIELMENK